MSDILNILNQTFKSWKQNNISILAAALVYYTLFALAPLLLIALSIIEFIFSAPDLENTLLSQISKGFDPNLTNFVVQILKSLDRNNSNFIASIVSFVVLSLAINILVNFLQKALNSIWKVKMSTSLVMNLVALSLRTFIILCTFTGLWISSLFLGNLLSQSFFTEKFQILGFVLDFIISRLTVTIFLVILQQTLIHKFVPWKPLWIGSFINAILLFIARFPIDFYITNISPVSAYGSAGIIVVLLIWLFYSAQIFLFGVELTKILTVNFEKLKQQA